MSYGPTDTECRHARPYVLGVRSLSANEAYELNDRLLRPIAARERAKDAGQPVAVTRSVDQSIYPRCNTCIGEGGGYGIAVGVPGPIAIFLALSRV